MLSRLKPLFSLGLGARLGNGRQYLPWISLEDQVRALMFAITHDELSGPVNFTGPAPVTNAEFTTALGRTLNRPTPLVVPGFALRVVLGEFADEGVLGGQRAIPAALERAGFQFHHHTIGEALAFATPQRTARVASVHGGFDPVGQSPVRCAPGHPRLPGRLGPAAADWPTPAWQAGPTHFCCCSIRRCTPRAGARCPRSGPSTARRSSTPTAAARSPGTVPASWSATRSSAWLSRSTW